MDQRLEPNYQSYSLNQVAARLSALSQSLPGTASVGPELARELQVAALCCLQAHARWEDLVEFMRAYRLERANLESWIDSEFAYLESAAPSAGEDLSHLRPDDAGAYAWDRWQSQALAAGLSQDLAELGRAVMREAVQHDWEPALKAECGWLDAGQALLELAQRDPEGAAARWQHLLETDGERGHWGPDGEWHAARGGRP